jgi:ABC-type antimicrobial peptide transport system permease subunit
VVKEALLMATGGVLLGLLLAVPLTRWLVAKLLFDTQPNDPLTFIGVGGILALIAVLAAYVPARRATRVDPMIALRAE